MLRRQLSRTEATQVADDPMRAALVAEITALEENKGRIPWQDGLPSSIVESFAPFRSELDASYSRAAAEFELMHSQVKRGGLTITAD
jgi:hypothetical protein